MAVLSDQGAHCAVASCRQRDFLPFTCDQCGRVFCLEHFRYEAHSCPKAAGKDNCVLVCPLCQKGVRLRPGEDPNATWERHVAVDCEAPEGRAPQKKERCPVQGCRQQLTAINSFSCQKCYRKVCLKHRFEDEHGCAAAVAAARRARPSAARTLATAATAARGAVTSMSSGAPSQGWACSRCTLLNSAFEAECAACGAVMPAGSAVPAPENRADAPPQGGVWRCGRCTLENAPCAAECEACGAPRPAGSESNCTVS
mmetsp:Transcript_99637/g.277446  ORF Transcript_99637/g.277446 Transcript_99637/m.277446 type:complete len:256 (-) Transcript_99637:217-984(-)